MDSQVTVNFVLFGTPGQICENGGRIYGSATVDLPDWIFRALDLHGTEVGTNEELDSALAATEDLLRDQLKLPSYLMIDEFDIETF